MLLLVLPECEPTGTEDQPFVGTADHGPPKVSHDIRSYVSLISRALEENVEANKTADSDSAVPVDAAVAATLRHLNLNES